MATSKSNSIGEVIAVADVQVAPRGRKAKLNEDLVKAFKTLKPNQALALSGLYGKVKADDKQGVGAEIRKNFKAARPGEKCKINFSPEGVPQVQLKVEEDAAAE